MNNSLVQPSTSIKETINQVGSNNVSVATQSAKALAEVQGKVFMAKQFPRDMTLVQNKIKSSCERKSLANNAEYQYPRGGTKVTGPTIKLLEVIAQCYGNIVYEWKVLHRDYENKISRCIANAWDLENNISQSIEFDVPHYRDTKGGRVALTDDRDIYEMEANMASRRLRKCLESVVPRDLVDQAREWCDETLSSGEDIPSRIEKAIKFFQDEYKVTPKQLEEYFGMSRVGFNKNTLISMLKITTSLKEGMATVDDLFPKKSGNRLVEEDAPTEEKKEQEAPKQAPKTFQGRFGE